LKSNSLPFSKREYPKGERFPFSDEFRFIGIDISREQLRENIEIRLEKRLSEGMVEEVEGLRKSGISWGRLEAFGLEYRWIARLLQDKITEGEMREKLATDSYHYAKRQMTFLRKLKRNGIRIEWRHL
jgi:tRNA dimethylallyltransferase